VKIINLKKLVLTEKSAGFPSPKGNANNYFLLAAFFTL